jgi:importin subunit alpha-6/7
MKESMVDSLWVISYCSDAGKSIIPTILETGVAQRIIELCNHESSAIVIPALRTLGNFVTGSDEQTQVMIDMGVLEVLNNLVMNED